MLDLLVAHDLTQRRMKEQFELDARVEGEAHSPGREQRPPRRTVSVLGGMFSLRRLPFGRALQARTRA